MEQRLDNTNASNNAIQNLVNILNGLLGGLEPHPLVPLAQKMSERYEIVRRIPIES